MCFQSHTNSSDTQVSIELTTTAITNSNTSDNQNTLTQPVDTDNDCIDESLTVARSSDVAMRVSDVCDKVWMVLDLNVCMYVMWFK